ncbi:MAG: ATP-binding protein [Clostridia bacterium]|nr:ATP-binding protein [Clostridia bacterium]MBQ8739850.1 ATP-binding protein [Clostridia bacterium]
MSKIKEIYLRLCMSSVFSRVMEKPLLVALANYCKDGITRDEKIKAYASFVNEIYTQGASLSALVCRLVLEDENVYIRAKAGKHELSECVASATEYELKAFEELSRLTPEDFASDMELSYTSPFVTEKIDFSREYENRIANLDKYGYGIFSSYCMFRLSDDKTIEPIVSADKTEMSKFVGYEQERQSVVDNTMSFIEGKTCTNILLCGDAGTGKSSTVKAVANHFFNRGIRLIELRKDQLCYLPYVMGKISENPLKFIIFIDDLSFNKNDDNFSMLKAALEGSASAKADNAVIYATSNRRHIIKETFGDRVGDDVHRNDTLQENLSLSERFGLIVYFQKPNKALYLDIVRALAKRNGISLSEAELDVRAEAFALRRGSRSARCAEQFIESLK